MNTTKHFNSKGLQLDQLTVSNPTRSLLSPQATSNGIITTKEQQQRIDKLLSEVRRGGPLSPEASILPQTELQRMKQAAKFMTKDELLQQKKIIEEQTEKQHAASKAKKAKMLEIERERRKNVPLTEIEQENLERDDFLRERAQTLLDEERDEVKHMNKMMLYAKVVTLRDKQLNEKKNIQTQNKAEERLKDLNMELTRLKTIKFYEDLEEYKMGEQKKAAAETMRQIHERSLLKLKAREERDREGVEMVEKLKQNAIEDAQENLAKKRHQKLMQDMVFEENQKAIAGKALIAQLEREEEEKIFKYNQEKARKDAEYAAELKRINEAKEAETIRLRKLQEKYADRQSEIDAIRAKRAFESTDRMAREKERRDAETKARLNRELLEARHLQHLEKERRLQEQAKAERDEFQRIVANQKMERDIELLMDKEKKSRIQEHSEQLKKQIAMNQEKRAQNKRMSTEEGKKIKDRLNGEKNLLESIKTRKLNELISYDIAVKYTSELAKKRINI